MGELGRILTRVDGGRRQDPRSHAHGDLVDDAGWVGGVLHGVTRRALGGHQVGHGASGAQGGGRRVGVEVGLGGEVGGGGQVRVHGAVAGAVVWEGVWCLGHRGGDVGLLPSVTPRAICGDVLLSLEGRGTRRGLRHQGWTRARMRTTRERPRGAGAGERRERRGVRRRARWGGGGGGGGGGKRARGRRRERSGRRNRRRLPRAPAKCQLAWAKKESRAQPCSGLGDTQSQMQREREPVGPPRASCSYEVSKGAPFSLTVKSCSLNCRLSDTSLSEVTGTQEAALSHLENPSHDTDAASVYSQGHRFR